MNRDAGRRLEYAFLALLILDLVGIVRVFFK